MFEFRRSFGEFLQIYFKMTPLESSVSDVTIWRVTLESSIMILEASFTLIYDVYCTGVTYDDCQLMIITCLKHRLLMS